MEQSLKEEAFSCRFAKDGEEAIRKMCHKKPDILILDLMMPKKDGFTVLDEMQHIPVLKNTPVIIVTSKDLSSKEKIALQNRASTVIQKSGATIEQIMEILLHKVKEKLGSGFKGCF